MNFMLPFFLAAAISSKDPSYQLRHELSNVHAEMQMLIEKIQNQEDIIETLKRDLDLSKKEGSVKGLLKDFKAQKDESDTRIKELEKTVSKQSDSIEHLKSALSSLIDGFKGEKSDSSYATYEVKSGDSLGVIAQQCKVSIKLLKELNKLKSDAIYKGQKLRIPEKQ